MPITPKALCYVDDWYKGFAVLTAYKAGTYVEGMEKDLTFGGDINDTVNRIIADYSRYKKVPYITKPTFADVYKLYYKDKYENTKKQYSTSAIRTAKAAFKNCGAVHDRFFDELTIDDLQAVLDSCKLKHASIEHMVTLIKGMYGYAVPHGIAEKDYGRYIKITIPDDEEHGQPFTEDDILLLWKNRKNKIASSLIVMCYTGFRISAYKDIKKTPTYFQGGVKTRAGKNRIVPLLPAIQDIAKDFSLPDHKTFRRNMYLTLEQLGIERHTPHDCRHTFSMLCDKYHVDHIAKKKLLGHSLGNDISNGIYGHWDYDMLRQEIEKIQVPWKFY